MSNDVTIAKVVFNRIPAIARALGSDGNRIVQKVATDVQETVVTSMEGSKSGRYYAIPGVRSSTVGGGGRRHRASAPGQAPARMTGALAASISIKRSFNRATVGASSSYAPHLEYGTSRMANRPFMRPAARKHQKAFGMAVGIMVKRAAGAGR
jgi:phage gpG-like protein